MYIETIDYYDKERGHRKTTVDPRMVHHLVRAVETGICRCEWKRTVWRFFEGSYYLVPSNPHQLKFPAAYDAPLVPVRRGFWVYDKSGKVRNAIGIDDALVISEDDEPEDVDERVDEVLRIWGYPGRKPFSMCEHAERL